MPSARFTTAALAQESAECPVHLVTIEHASFAQPIRWCTGGADIVSNGQTFVARAMKVVPPGDSVDPGGRRGRITVDNADLAGIGQLRLAVSQPTAKIEVILAGYPNDIERTWSHLQVVGQRPNAQVIELEVIERDDASEVFPYQKFTPFRFPALFD